jgi:hypothetical protein
VGYREALSDDRGGASTAAAPEYFAVECTEARLLGLLREVFEEHWAQVVFGPCIEGAVFEGRFTDQPRVTLLDGYVTAQIAGAESWHFHLCIGPHRGSPGLPTLPALAEWRCVARAAFFQSRDRAGCPSAWGLRLERPGRADADGLLPELRIDPARRPLCGHARLVAARALMDLRASPRRVPAEAPPVHAEPPRTH